MAKTELTLEIEKAFMYWLSKMGTFICPEVGIQIEKWYCPYKLTKKDIENGYKEHKIKGLRTELVDILLWESNKSLWKCYEIKVSKSDFKSKSAKTFIGNYNYYIMPVQLAREVADEIPNNIGIYVYDKESRYDKTRCYRKAKYQELKVNKDILYYSMIKSLYREMKNKSYDSSKLEFENNSFKKEKADLIQDIQEDITKECRGTEVLSDYQNGLVQYAQRILNILENKRTRRDK